MNNRHPEAKEQMLRTFALGVAEQHRRASRPPVAKSPATGAAVSELDSEAREAVAMKRMASAMKSGLTQRNQSNAVARAVSP